MHRAEAGPRSFFERDGMRTLPDREQAPILIAEHRPGLRLRLQLALASAGIRRRLEFVGSFEDLFDYLRHRGRHATSNARRSPALLLLDSSLPGDLDREDAFQWVRIEAELAGVPLVLLSTTTRSSHGLAGRTVRRPPEPFMDLEPMSVKRIADLLRDR